MSLAVVLGVGALGGLGAVLRFLVDRTVTRRTGGSDGRSARFPLGTLVVNLSGALVLGVFAGAALRGDGYEVFGVGLIGGYTTFSTWMLESQRLAEAQRRRAAAINIIGSVVLGVLAVWLGRTLG